MIEKMIFISIGPAYEALVYDSILNTINKITPKDR
jgi:hypothetical protein